MGLRVPIWHVPIERVNRRSLLEILGDSPDFRAIKNLVTTCLFSKYPSRISEATESIHRMVGTQAYAVAKVDDSEETIYAYLNFPIGDQFILVEKYDKNVFIYEEPLVK